MNINSLITNQTTQLNGAAAPLDTATSAASPAAATSSGEATQANLSGPGQLMSKLTQLKQSDPAKFKDVVSKMAASLKDAAAQHSGRAADMLNNLASKLDNVANGGDIAQLQPPGGGPHGAGGHHHGHHAHGAHGSPPPDGAAPPDGAGPADGGESAEAAHKYGDNAASSDHDTIRQTLDSVFGQLDAALSNSATA